MEMTKAHWASSGSDVKLTMPIAKVDVERRIVSGFATLDNLDRQDDIVPSAASLKAFNGFRGNIREMHQPLAVGKVVSFKEDKFYDEKTQKFYAGVFVSAYVSKGAQSTWEKVLDGTLSGFSIGGNIKEAEDTFDENLGKMVRIIKDYELYELSLVDSPANQYANVLSIQKGSDSGYLAKALIENVFWCGSDDVVKLSPASSSDCPRCDMTMKNIGFVETDDTEKADVVKAMLSTIKNNDEKEVHKMEDNSTSVDETVTDVTKSVDEAETPVEKSDTVVEEVAIEKADSTEAADEPVAKSDDEEPATEEAPVAEKDVTALVDITKSFEETTNALTAVVTDLVSTVKSLASEVSDLKKASADTQSALSTVQSEFGKRVDAVEKDTAFRKSGDIGDIVQETVIQKSQESLWGGRFLTKSDLFN